MTPPKVGADDFIRATNADAAAMDRLPRSDVELPEIEADDQDLARLAAAAWAALQAANEPPQLFRWGGTLARIERDDHGAPVPSVLTVDRLRYHLARVATWRSRRGDQLRPAYPPIPVVRDLLARPEPPLPVLEAITETPTFSPSGRLHAMPGYNPESRLVYAPAPGFSLPPIPPTPTAEDISEARHLITKELLGDFPFVSPADLAHAVALALTVLARPLVLGPIPLFEIEKPTPGTTPVIARARVRAEVEREILRILRILRYPGSGDEAPLGAAGLALLL